MAREALQLFKAGRLEQAPPAAQGAVAIARVCSPEHALLACVLHGLGRIEEACAAVNDALSLPTGTADAYDGLAYVSQALGQHERARTLYARATELAPSEPRFQCNLACRPFATLAFNSRRVRKLSGEPLTAGCERS